MSAFADVNNLIRLVERASPSIMQRWRAEQSGMVEHVCATDWLVAVCVCCPAIDRTRSCSGGSPRAPNMRV